MSVEGVTRQFFHLRGRDPLPLIISTLPDLRKP